MCEWHVFFFKQKTAYELRISDWSSDVCSSDLGLTIRGSGIDVPAMDSAVLVRQSAERATVVDNRLEDNLFGVYLHGAAGSRVENNVIHGRRDLRISEAGNGVSIWNAPGAAIVGNDIRHGQIGSEACREGVGQTVWTAGVAGTFKKKNK